MICCSKWKVIFAYTISFIGLLIFAKGFFPMKALPQHHSNFSSVPVQPTDKVKLVALLKEDVETDRSSGKKHPSGSLSAPFNKLVFILIDAMRFDFINSLHYRKHMPYVEKLINNGHAKLYKSQAKAPTVTLPRLKALLTGSVPGYLNVILNLDQSAALKEDSIISSFTQAKKKMIFYGDTMWIRLFPDAFIRKDGTLSLYVTDYTEVDDNVTRHLDDELNNKKDWDAMFLHYLGLDHVGHLVGPYSTLMPTKLSEMDGVIKLIHSSLQQEENTLIVVTSDHGMTSQGSHGGTTSSEVDTPILFLYTNPQISSWSSGEIVQQTDLAPTLAMLMGVPIPSTSMGCVIPSSLEVMDKSNELHSLQYNCHHLLKRAAYSGAYHEFAKKNHPVNIYRNGLQFHGEFLFGDKKSNTDLFNHAKKLYSECQDMVSAKLTSKLASYDYPVMAVGACLLALGLCLSVFLWLKTVVLSRNLNSANSESSKRMTRALLALCLGCLLHVITLPGSSFVEEEHQIWHFLTASVCLFVFAAFLRTIAQTESSPSRKPVTSSLYDAQINHSSILRLRKDLVKNETWTLDNSQSNLEMVQNGSPTNEMVPPVTSKLPMIKESQMVYVGVAFLAVIAHRLLRAWNQTGIKYADEPDIEDFLNAAENKSFLSFLSFVGLLSTFFLLHLLCTSRDYIRILLSCMGLIGAFVFRVSICFVHLPWTTDTCGKGIMEARLVYLCIGLLLLKSIYHRLVLPCTNKKRSKSHTCSAPRICGCSNISSEMRKSVDCFTSAVVLLSALLLRPHNHWVLACNLFIYIIIFRLLWPVVVENSRLLSKSSSLIQLFTEHREDFFSSFELVARVVLAFWFGQMSFFTLGNSNSLGTVDISAAYIGLSGSEGLFNYVGAGALGTLATYAGPMLWIVLVVSDIVRSGSTVSSDLMMGSPSTVGVVIACTLACLRLISLTVYVAVATGHRYHLFVWSVFSPKLMYEIFSTAVHLGLLLVIMFLC